MKFGMKATTTWDVIPKLYIDDPGTAFNTRPVNNAATVNDSF